MRNFNEFAVTLIASALLLCGWPVSGISWAAQENEINLRSDDSGFDAESDADLADSAKESPALKGQRAVANVSTYANASTTEESQSEDDLSPQPLEGSEELFEAPAPTAEEFNEPVPDELAPLPPGSNQAQEELSIAPAPVAVRDEPNLELESRLHDIYINYHSTKMTDEAWSTLIAGRESESFDIRQRDTLWDISRVLFGDGQYWPKIWQINSKIGNPHLITPGNQIRILMGSESETPAFTVTESEAPSDNQGVEVAPVEVPAQAGVIEGEGSAMDYDTGAQPPGATVEIPPPLEVRAPVLKRVPPSLPNWTSTRNSPSYDDAGISFARRPILDLKESRVLEGFVSEETLQAEGEIKEIEDGSETASNNQFVFVSLPEGKGGAGDVFTVIESLGPIKQVSRWAQILYPGTKYRISGEVELGEKITTIGGLETKDIFRGRLKNCVFQVHTGSMLIRGAAPRISTESSAARTSIQAQIIGGSVLRVQNLLALHTLAFLSAGSNDGLQVGQSLVIRANTRVRNPDSIVRESYIPVGMLKIVRVSPRYATAVITKAWGPIYVGDVTGDGVVLPPEVEELADGSNRAAEPSSGSNEKSNEVESGGVGEESDFE